MSVFYNKRLKIFASRLKTGRRNMKLLSVNLVLFSFNLYFLFSILVKRRQDKEKLKELEQTRAQLDQLSEFKTRILESKTALQRELQQARKEAQDAIDARNAHAEEMTDLADTVEMATLDKEMAEEKVCW